jgi:hypothetical protein
VGPAVTQCGRARTPSSHTCVRVVCCGGGPRKAGADETRAARCMLPKWQSAPRVCYCHVSRLAWPRAALVPTGFTVLYMFAVAPGLCRIIVRTSFLSWLALVTGLRNTQTIKQIVGDAHTCVRCGKGSANGISHDLIFVWGRIPPGPVSGVGCRCPYPPCRTMRSKTPPFLW